jgi:homopolymeric O-antigen transport system permease protein
MTATARPEADRDLDLSARWPQGKPVVIIGPWQPGVVSRFKEVVLYRRLIRFFATRAIKKMYARTRLGVFWIVFRPIAGTVSQVLVFSGILHLKGPGDVPYLLFFVIGMSAWTLFDRGVYWATRGIELNRKMVTKMYFPRLILPFSASAVGILDFLIYAVLALLLLIGYAITRHHFYIIMSPRLLGALVGFVYILLFMWGLALWTSVLGAATRDLRFSLSFLLSFWFMVTPVIYPLSSIQGDTLRLVASLNPLAPSVEMVKWGSIGAGQLYLRSFGISCGVLLVIWIGGLRFFGKAEAAAVDRI